MVAESHSDEVIYIPGDFEVIAYSDICSVEAMKHREKPIYTVQFHPELYEMMEEHGYTNEHGDTVLDNSVEIQGCMQCGITALYYPHS